MMELKLHKDFFLRKIEDEILENDRKLQETTDLLIEMSNKLHEIGKGNKGYSDLSKQRMRIYRENDRCIKRQAILRKEYERYKKMDNF